MNRFDTQHVSLPAIEGIKRPGDPHPTYICSFDRSKVEAFVIREQKRDRIVECWIDSHRFPSGAVYAQFHATSHPKVKVHPKATLAQPLRFGLRDDDLNAKYEKSRKRIVPLNTPKAK